MSVRLALGTLQYVPVRVRDSSGEVTAIDPSAASFTIRRKSDDAAMYTDEPAPNTLGMIIYCLVDTRTGSWTKEDYYLWVRFEDSPEIPYLGPLVITVT